MALFEDHHPFITMPGESDRLWRYISFARYMMMLNTSKLWFSRLDKFDDPFEGAVTPFNAIIRENQRKGSEVLSRPSVRGHFDWLHEGRRRMHYANCWHMSDIESNAMWEKYRSTETVAIVSDRSGFRDGLLTEREIFLGKVNYKNYLPGTSDFVEDGNGFGAIFTKRNNFEYEKEVRAVLLDVSDMASTTHDGVTFPKMFADNPDGIEIEVNLEKLIKEVKIHPKGGSHLLQAVEASTKSQGFGFRISDSKMNAKPIY